MIIVSVSGFWPAFFYVCCDVFEVVSKIYYGVDVLSKHFVGFAWEKVSNGCAVFEFDGVDLASEQVNVSLFMGFP